MYFLYIRPIPVLGLVHYVFSVSFYFKSITINKMVLCSKSQPKFHLFSSRPHPAGHTTSLDSKSNVTAPLWSLLVHREKKELKRQMDRRRTDKINQAKTKEKHLAEE